MAEIAQDELTDAVYRAALEPTAWGDVMRLMKARFPSTAQTFYFLHRGSHQVRPISLSGVEPAWLASFDEFYFAPDNPWIRFTEQLHQPGVVRTNERLDAFIREHGTLYRSSYYNEWMRPHGFRYSLGSTLLAGDGIVANVTLLRPPDTATFSSEEVAAFTRLTGHLTRALQMAIRLERAETGLTSVHALAALPQAVALVDASHRVVYANAAMESRLREAKGLSLRHGVLHAMRAQPQLAALVSGAIGPAAGTGQPPLILACGERSHLVEKWPRKSAQRDKWKLRARSWAEDGLARRSFRWSRNQRAVPGARTARRSRRGWPWPPCARTRRWPSCARSSSCTPRRSSNGSDSCLRARPMSSAAATTPQHRWTWPHCTPRSANWRWRMIF